MRLPHSLLFPLFAVSVYIVSHPAIAGSNAQEWAMAGSPTVTADGGQSIGTYTSGCIRGAVALPLQGKGYQVMRLSRKRYYGHQNLIDFIERLGETTVNANLGTLLIGDLGQSRGGPTLTGHRSHQTGLDVDIWFLLSDQAGKRLLTPDERETWNATSTVDLKTDRIDYRNWSDAHAKVLEAAARLTEVDRIFVHPAIKQELCNRKQSDSAEWLRKIRPWWKHDDHFHVRLRCPEHNANCEPQPPLPTGDGCDASLAWWFSEEAKAPSKSAPTPPPPLPAMCEQVLRE